MLCFDVLTLATGWGLLFCLVWPGSGVLLSSYLLWVLYRSHWFIDHKRNLCRASLRCSQLDTKTLIGHNGLHVLWESDQGVHFAGWSAMYSWQSFGCLWCNVLPYRMYGFMSTVGIKSISRNGLDAIWRFLKSRKLFCTNCDKSECLTGEDLWTLSSISVGV